MDENDPLAKVDLQKFTPVYSRNAKFQYFLDLENANGCFYNTIHSPSLGPFVLMTESGMKDFEGFKNCLLTETEEHVVIDTVLKYFLENQTNLAIMDVKISEHVALLPQNVADLYRD